jgi:xylulokinase
MKERVVFAGGGGDNAAGAVGVGVVHDGEAFISLGTSGVYFAGTDSFRACPEKTVHAFCHAVPGAWHQMGVILSAASCIKTATRFLGAESDQKLADLVSRETYNFKNKTVFLPYLSGERTPHNDPSATGCFFGLTHETTRADLVQSILEGVAFAFLDCQRALEAAGTKVDEVMLIGGGARNKLWGEIIAAALQKRVVYVKDGDQGPAFGGAKLARLAATGEALTSVIGRPEVLHIVEPDLKLIEYLSPKAGVYDKLYGQLKSLF